MTESHATARTNSALSMEIVRKARELLRPIVPKSRIARSDFLSTKSRAEVFLKLECEGPTGTFKVRGAYHAIHHRNSREKIKGVVTSSTGNHGAATAFAASLLKLPVRVYLPENPNPTKRARIAKLGAEIVEAGSVLEDSRKHAAKFAAENGWYNIVDGVDPDMLPGPATIACEILEELPEADAIVVPVGDSTLIRGLAFAARSLKPGIKIYGVQAEKAPAYALSFREGKSVCTKESDTMADGLSVRDTSEENVQQIAKLVDDFVLVSEDDMLRAIKKLLLEEHLVVEPAGAASVAALEKLGEKIQGRKVVSLITGSNISEEILRRTSAIAF